MKPTTAGLMVDELEPRCAVTLEANDLILTNVRAAAIVHKALVKICGKATHVTFTPAPRKTLSGVTTLKGKENVRRTEKVTRDIKVNFVMSVQDEEMSVLPTHCTL